QGIFLPLDLDEASRGLSVSKGETDLEMAGGDLLADQRVHRRYPDVTARIDRLLDRRRELDGDGLEIDRHVDLGQRGIMGQDRQGRHFQPIDAPPTACHLNRSARYRHASGSEVPQDTAGRTIV